MTPGSPPPPFYTYNGGCSIILMALETIIDNGENLAKVWGAQHLSEERPGVTIAVLWAILEF